MFVRFFAKDPVVCCVSLSCGQAVQKWLNASRSRFGWKLLGTQGTLYQMGWGPSIPTMSVFIAAFAKLLWPSFV